MVVPFAAALAAFAPSWAWLLVSTQVACLLAARMAPVGLWATCVVALTWTPNTSFTAVLVVAGGVALAVMHPRGRGGPRAPAIWWPLLGYALLAAATVQLTLAPWETIRSFYLPGTGLVVAPFPSYESLSYLQFLMLPAIGVATARTIRLPRASEAFGVTVVLASVAPIAMGLRDFATGDVAVRQGYAAVQSLYVHPNQFATFLVVLIPLLVATAWSHRWRPVRLAAAGLTVAGIACLALTYTRSAWAGAAIAVILAGLLGGYWRRTAAVTAVAVLALVLSGAGAVVVGRFADLVPSSSAVTTTDSLSWRLYTWSEVLGDTPRAQLLGSGFDTYSRRSVEVIGFGNPKINVVLQPDWRPGFGAHNDLVRQYVELGLVGLGLWLAFLGGLLGYAVSAWRRARQPLGMAAASAAIAVAIAGLSDNIESYSGYSLVLVAVLVARHASWQVTPRVRTAPQPVPDDEARSSG